MPDKRLSVAVRVLALLAAYVRSVSVAYTARF